MSSFTRTLTLNGTTAKLTLHTTLNKDNMCEWTLELSTGKEGVDKYTTTTGGWTTMKAVPAPAPAPAPAAPSPAPATPAPATSPAEEKTRHIEFIKGILADVSEARGRDARAAITKILFDYLAGSALEFVKNHQKFKDTVIAKGYELKQEAPEKTGMVSSIDRVLTALGQPLVKPVMCWGCHQTPCVGTAKPVNTVVQPVAVATPAPPGPTPAPAPKPTPAPAARTEPKDNDPDFVLFKAVAKRLKCTSVLDQPRLYYGYYLNGQRWGSNSEHKSKAARMEAYMASWWCYGDDDYQRQMLMKSLFAKNKLVWSDEVMPMYNDWVPTYKPTGRPNRYKKMCAFIDTFRPAFTAPA
jgi:hypothetical protein